MLSYGMFEKTRLSMPACHKLRKLLKTAHCSLLIVHSIASRFCCRYVVLVHLGKNIKFLLLLLVVYKQFQGTLTNETIIGREIVINYNELLLKACHKM